MNKRVKLTKMRDSLQDLTKRAQAHPRRHVVATLGEIVKQGQATLDELEEGLTRIAKGETTDSDAEQLSDRLVYDHEASVDILRGALRVMDDEQEHGP